MKSLLKRLLKMLDRFSIHDILEGVAILIEKETSSLSFLDIF